MRTRRVLHPSDTDDWHILPRHIAVWPDALTFLGSGVDRNKLTDVSSESVKPKRPHGREFGLNDFKSGVRRRSRVLVNVRRFLRQKRTPEHEHNENNQGKMLHIHSSVRLSE